MTLVDFKYPGKVLLHIRLKSILTIVEVYFNHIYLILVLKQFFLKYLETSLIQIYCLQIYYYDCVTLKRDSCTLWHVHKDGKQFYPRKSFKSHKAIIIVLVEVNLEKHSLEWWRYLVFLWPLSHSLPLFLPLSLSLSIWKITKKTKIFHNNARKSICSYIDIGYYLNIDTNKMNFINNLISIKIIIINNTILENSKL